MSIVDNRDAYLQLVEARGIIDGRFTDIKRIGSNGGHGQFSLVFSARDRRPIGGLL